MERERAVGDAARAILPVLDDLDRAEAHGDLAEGGPLTAIAQKLRGAIGKLGLTPFGENGQLFDPREHDAIFQRENPAVDRGHGVRRRRAGLPHRRHRPPRREGRRRHPRE